MSTQHELPPITLASNDYNRLLVTVMIQQEHNRRTSDFLLKELRRAKVCHPSALPEDVVSTNCRVIFRIDDEPKSRAHLLVHPDDQIWPGAEISVTTPLGTALLGLRVGDRMSFVEQPVPPVRVGVGARRGDRVCGRAGNEADGCAGGSERTLHLEHGLQPRSTGDRPAELGGDEQRVERGHTAKNVVCDGPWRQMSKRRAPSSATATSVSRCSGGRRESTGSSAFASVSSGK